MELVPGTDLAARLRGGPLEEREAVRLVRDLARAVHYAHSLNVLHLDLKPQNVLLEPDGRARIADFGLARPLDRAMSAEATELLAGTPAYMAPEQTLLRAAEISRATDVYGLGAILYQCLTGRAPFQRDTAQATLQAVAEAPLVTPRSLRRTLSRDVEAICVKCLQRDPAQRYESAEALAEDLGRLLDGNAVQARRLRWAERAWRWVVREPVTLGGLAMAAVVMLAASAAVLLQLDRNRRSEWLTREAFTAGAEALLAPGDTRTRLDTVQRIEMEAYPFTTQRSLPERIELHSRLRDAVALRGKERDPVVRELSLLLARDHFMRDKQAWRAALARRDTALAWLLHMRGTDAPVQWRHVLDDLAKVAQSPALGDMELALAANVCRLHDQLPPELQGQWKGVCDSVYRRARPAASRNTLFLLLQPEFDDAAREAWLAAMHTTPLDDYGPRFYRESLALLETIAPEVAAEDLHHGLSSRDIAALAADELTDTPFWGARGRIYEPCRKLDKHRDEVTFDLCRRSLATPSEGWTSWFGDVARRSAQRRLDLAERGAPMPMPVPVPDIYDYQRRAYLIACCSQRGAHPEWVRLRAEAGEHAAEEWLYRELGESPYR